MPAHSLASFPRRHWLAGAAALPVAGVASALADQGKARTVSVFHTTDLHGRILPTSTYDGLDDVGGFARCASCLRQWRRDTPWSLTVDVGDVVQGTAVSLASDGRVMLDLFNLLGYDAWTLGNHDFDWGPESLAGNLAASVAPVLTANLVRGGKPTGSLDGAWEKVRPWVVREVGGFRIGLIGLITPGLPFWLAPETLGGVEPLPPDESLAKCLAEIAVEKPDAIVVLGHMGYRFQDDYANPVREILKKIADGKGPKVDVYLAGHSHQDQPSWTLHDVLCSQASYHGIHCGRVDLTFDLDSRKLVDKRAFTLLMDDRYPLDPVVMDRARPDLARSDEQLAREVATVNATIGGEGRGSALVQLFCRAFQRALAKRGTPVDGVFHGTFNTGDLKPGRLTVADCWKLIPYENILVTASLTPEEMVEIVREDAGDKRSDRTLWPFELILTADGRPGKFLFEGQPVDPGRRYRIAFNSYDAQSGGRRLFKLREIVSRAGSARALSTIDTRSALIDGLLDMHSIG
ncbi:MAG: bifunctional metallophosphatase/5'-nucleotidase [Planctomycetaceae bacterium]